MIGVQGEMIDVITMKNVYKRTIGEQFSIKTSNNNAYCNQVSMRPRLLEMTNIGKGKEVEMSKVLEIVNCPNGYKSILKAYSVIPGCTKLDSCGLTEQRSSLSLHYIRGGSTFHLRRLMILMTHDPQNEHSHIFPRLYASNGCH